MGAFGFSEITIRWVSSAGIFALRARLTSIRTKPVWPGPNLTEVVDCPKGCITASSDLPDSFSTTLLPASASMRWTVTVDSRRLVNWIS